MPMLKGYPDGSDITIIDAIYTKPKKDDNTDKWTKPTMDIIFRDNKTNLKHVQRIEDPKIQFYMANDDVFIEPDVYPPYLPIDKVHPVICKYNNLKATLAKLTGQYEEYLDNIRCGLSKNNEKIHKNNKLYRSDMQIEDYYRYEFDKRYTNNVDLPLKKMYLDIEVDGINMLGDFPDPSDSPINAVTLIDDITNNVYTYLLRDKDNPLCKQFEDSLKDPDTFRVIKAFITEHLGGYKKASRLGCENLEYHFFFFDEEIEMVYDIFRAINTLQPDFVLAWNMAFDIPFIIDRIKFLGYDPRNIMRHPDFDFCDDLYYYVDERHINEPAESGDFARIPSYSIYLDQMKQFASRRKGQHAFPSNKLDDIAYAVAGIHKYDYHSITPDLVKLPRTNYFIFVMYNILDVICQKAIEKKTGDIDFVFNKCITTNTRYSKVHRQTIYLYNKAAKSYELNGFIICNNINKWNPKPDRKFKGAYVADYRLNDDSLKVSLNGHPIDVYNNADDFDYRLVA